jgi:hypothetical protein
LDARHAGGDRGELAADFGGGVHLQVVHVLVGRPAAEVDHDHGFVRILDAGLSLEGQELRERQAAESESADAEERAA